MSLAQREVAGIALRLILWLPLLLWAAWQWSWDYAHGFLPLYREVLNAAMDGFNFTQIEIIHTHEYLIKVDYTVERMLVIGGRVLPPHLDGYVHAPIYYVLTHPIILAVAALSWPGLTWHGRALRLLASLPILVVLEALDIPLVMFSSINDALIQVYDPKGYLVAKPTDWVRLLEGGGRFALCIAGAFAAAGLHAWLDEYRKRTATNQNRRNFPARL